MKVLSLAWKYHPFITSGVGVACEGLNNALSKIVDLTVIYPKVSKVTVKDEILLDSEDLTEEQRSRIDEAYIRRLESGNYELAIRMDPYFATRSRREAKEINAGGGRQSSGGIGSGKSIKGYRYSEKWQYEDVDVFGESVQDKIFLYNRLVEELAGQLYFDIIHAHDWMTFLAGIALKNTYHKPLVLHVHSLEYDRVGHKDASWVYDVERYAMSKADAVISASDYTKGIIESNYGLSGRGILTVYNAVSEVAEIKEINVVDQSKFNVLFAGRIDGNKGLEYFVEIARQVLAQANDVQFVVVGRGRGEVNFDAIEGFSEIRNRFHYLGHVAREELFYLYKSCQVLCMPSISEPFGLTAIEAAAAGLPVILSTRTGASEILKKTPMADFWDTKEFADHILSLREKPELRERIIKNNMKDVSSLSWENAANAVYDLYKSLVSFG